MSASDKKKLRKEQAAAQLTERQKKELAEAKKLRNISVAFVAVMVIVALVALSVLGVRAVNNSGIIDKNTHAATVAEHQLNSVQMNYYLNDYIRQWASSYGENLSTYAAMMGLNLNKPINEQVTDNETGKTWADRFLADAMEKAKNDYTLYDKAMAEGFELSEDEQEALDSTTMQLDLYAAYSGYSNAKKYLSAIYGYGSDVESYTEYLRISTIASAYYNQYRDSLKYEDSAIREHESKHPDDYTSYSYASYYVNSASYLTGGTTDESGNKVYTEEEKATALKKAEEIAKSLAASADIATLDEAISALEINAGNNTVSTKNKHIMYTSIPSSLQSWLSDKARVNGDIAMLPSESTSTDANGNTTKTTNGYYVVVFEHRDENLRLLANVRHLLVKFEGGTTGADGNKVYSSAEKAAAKDEAEKLLQTWKDGAATEESFIALVKEHSDDTSASEGGLFENIHRNSGLVESFEIWSIDVDRKPGDTAVIISDYGYHVMYYVGDGEMTYRDYMISEELREDDTEKWYDAIVKDATITAVNTKRLNLDAVLAYM